MSTQSAKPRVQTERLDDTRYRHWSAESETYAPVEVLIKLVREGWQLDKLAAVEAYFYAGNRYVEILYFTLWRDGEGMEIPVLSNPVSRRLIQEHKLTVIRVNVNRDLA